MQNILLECARRDLSKSGVYFYHAGVMARAARDFRVCWGRRLLPALSDFGTGRPSSRLDDTWCPPIITEHFATISSGCGGARARSAVVTSSALLELPPGELSASLTAVTRFGTFARASLMQWAQLPQNKRRGGVRGGPLEAAQKLTSTQRRMRASEGSFMGSDSAGRPVERPQQEV